MTAEDIREMTFQNVLDQVLKPAGVHVGGYPEEMFLDLSEEEKEKWICNICFLMVRDARECNNKHLFCHTCVFAWSLTYGENSQKCPMCRSAQRTYLPNKDVDKLIKDKRVKCQEEDCTFSSPLRIFLMHSHGRDRFVNDNVDLESLRPARPPQLSQVILLPGSISMPGGAVRASNIREQLQQGRAMIHQMMLLLHLEMQLRQQALVSYSQAQDPDTRLRRLDEVLSLNEQLNEVGTILSALLSTAPLTGRGPQGPSGSIFPPESPNSSDSLANPPRIGVSTNVMLSRGPGLTSRGSTGAGASGGLGLSPSREVLLSRGSGASAVTPGLSNFGQRIIPPSLARSSSTGAGDEEDEDDEESSDDTTSVSSAGSVVPRLRMSINGQLNSPRRANTDLASESNNGLRTDLSRPLRRSEIRAHILSTSSDERDSSNNLQTPRLARRESISNNSNSSRRNENLVTQGNNNESVTVSVRRIGGRSSNSNQSNPSETSNTAVSLPPLTNSNNVSNTPTTQSRSRSIHGNSLVSSQNNNVSNSSETITSNSSSSGLIPSGSSVHQRILRSMNRSSDDEDEDDENSPPSFTRMPNSTARHDTTPRQSAVTAQGVTASGATFQMSADTPLTRAASRQAPSISPRSQITQGSLTNDQTETTPSGAAVSVQAQAPVRPSVSGLAVRESTEVRTPLNSSSSQSESQNLRVNTRRVSLNVITRGSESRNTANGQVPQSGQGREEEQDVFVDEENTQRAPLRSFAPQRRFRRDSNNAQPSSTTVNRHNRSNTVPASPQVPYVPHGASRSPTRNRNFRINRSNSMSLETFRPRGSSVGGDEPAESVVRAAARGGNLTNRSSLPQTPGQLMRTRRRSDTRRPDNDPGGTI